MLLDRPSVGEFGLQHRVVRILSERLFADSGFFPGSIDDNLVWMNCWGTFTDNRVQADTHHAAKDSSDRTLLRRRFKVDVLSAPNLFEHGLAAFLTKLLRSLSGTR